jgi:hypothetical protein
MYSPEILNSAARALPAAQKITPAARRKMPSFFIPLSLSRFKDDADSPYRPCRRADQGLGKRREKTGFVPFGTKPVRNEKQGGIRR